MNEEHLRICASAEWAETVAREILPWAVDARELGDDVLEVGPGPGLTTDALRRVLPRLTAVEVDHDLASRLAARLAESNVQVVEGDATSLPFETGRFSGATCFTMLHHVPSTEEQDRLLAEVARVLRPGGLFVGVDSVDRPAWRDLHADDTCTPVDPSTLAARLERAGFTDVEVERGGAEMQRFRFLGRKRAFADPATNS